MIFFLANFPPLVHGCQRGENIEAIYPGAPYLGKSEIPIWRKARVTGDFFDDKNKGSRKGEQLLEVVWVWSPTVCVSMSQ